MQRALPSHLVFARAADLHVRLERGDDKGDEVLLAHVRAGGDESNVDDDAALWTLATRVLVTLSGGRATIKNADEIPPVDMAKNEDLPVEFLGRRQVIAGVVRLLVAESADENERASVDLDAPAPIAENHEPRKPYRVSSILPPGSWPRRSSTAMPDCQ